MQRRENTRTIAHHVTRKRIRRNDQNLCEKVFDAKIKQQIFAKVQKRKKSYSIDRKAKKERRK